MSIQVWRNADIVTMDPSRPRARAFAARDGEILGVGDDADVLAAGRSLLRGGEKIEERDMAGAAVLPGFNDNHVHAVLMGDHALSVDLGGLDERGIVALLRERFPDPAPGEIIRAFNWDYPSCPEPRKETLDEAFPRNAVVLSQFSGHAQWLNSAALRELGIRKGRSDPWSIAAHSRVEADSRGAADSRWANNRPTAGGRGAGITRLVGSVLRDADGGPTGIVRDLGDTKLSKKRMHDAYFVRRLREERLALALDTFARMGITSVQDNTWYYPQLFSLKKRSEEGSLSARFTTWALGRRPGAVAAIDAAYALGLGRRDWIRKGPIKYFLDGTFSTRNACLFEPFADQGGDELCADPAAPLAELELLARRGRQGAFHIIGDKGIAIFLDAYEKILARHPSLKHLRVRIEHAQLIRPGDIPRLRDLGVLIAAQPSALGNPAKDEILLGRDRALRAYPYRSLIDAGVALSFGSDIPGESSCDPIRSIHFAANREGAERISAEEAVRCYTVGSAYAEFMEGRKGAIAPGMLADFVVLSQDITAVPRETIGDTAVEETVVGGRTVYKRSA